MPDPQLAGPVDLERVDEALRGAACVAEGVAVSLEGGERPWAVVVPDEDALRELGIVNRFEAIRFRVENAITPLPASWRPRGLTIARAPLPRLVGGAVDRAALAGLLGATPGRAWPGAPAAGDPLPDAWQSWLRAQPELAQRSHVALTRTTSIEFDLGLDSLDRLALLASISAATARDLPERDHAHVRSLGDLVDAFGPQPPRAAASPAPALDRPAQRRAILGGPDHPAPRPDFTRPTGRGWPIVRAIIRPFSRSRLGKPHTPRFIGFDRVDWSRRPLIIAQNHQSVIDPEITSVFMPARIHRRMVFIGYAGYFSQGVGGIFGKLGRIQPIDADSWAIPGLRVVASAVRAGQVLLIYPEGERSWTARLTPFKRGVAWLAAETGAAVVPSAINGAFQAAPRGWPGRAPHPITVAYGTPIEPPPRDGGRADEDAFLDRLRNAISGLMREIGADPEHGDPHTWAYGPPATRTEHLDGK